MLAHLAAQATRVWQLMRERNVRANVVAYNSYLNALCKGERIIEALSIYDHELKRTTTGDDCDGEANDALTLPDVFTFTTLIAGCKWQQRAADAERLFDEMQSVFGIRPTEKTYAAMISVYKDCIIAATQHAPRFQVLAGEALLMDNCKPTACRLPPDTSSLV